MTLSRSSLAVLMAAFVAAGCSDNDSSPPMNPTGNGTSPQPTVHNLDLPSDGLGSLAAGMLMVLAGETETRGNVVFTCPAGGPDCGVKIEDSVGTLVATSTGGMATAMMVAMPMSYPVMLPEGSVGGQLLWADPDSDELMIPAGEMVTRVLGVGAPPIRYTCEGDVDCMLTVTNNLGTIVASSTGGMVTAVAELMLDGGPWLDDEHTLELDPGDEVELAAADTMTGQARVGQKFMCDKHGSPCTIHLMSDSDDEMTTATYTGGAVHASAVWSEEFTAMYGSGDNVKVKFSTDPMPIGKDPMNGVSHFVVSKAQNRSVSPNTVTPETKIIGYAGGVNGYPGMAMPSASLMAKMMPSSVDLTEVDADGAGIMQRKFMGEETISSSRSASIELYTDHQGIHKASASAFLNHTDTTTKKGIISNSGKGPI